MPGKSEITQINVPWYGEAIHRDELFDSARAVETIEVFCHFRAHERGCNCKRRRLAGGGNIELALYPFEFCISGVNRK